jgi:hypothetical protein
MDGPRLEEVPAAAEKNIHSSEEWEGVAHMAKLHLAVAQCWKPPCLALQRADMPRDCRADGWRPA